MLRSPYISEIRGCRSDQLVLIVMLGLVTVRLFLVVFFVLLWLLQFSDRLCMIVQYFRKAQAFLERVLISRVRVAIVVISVLCWSAAVSLFGDWRLPVCSCWQLECLGD